MVWRSSSLIRVRREHGGCRIHTPPPSFLPQQRALPSHACAPRTPRTMGMSTVMRMATRALRLLRHGHGPVKAAAMPETMANLDGAVMVAGPARAAHGDRETWRERVSGHGGEPKAHLPTHLPTHPIISLDAVRADRHLLHATRSRHSLMHPSYLQTPHNSSASNSSVARISTLRSVR